MDSLITAAARALAGRDPTPFSPVLRTVHELERGLDSLVAAGKVQSFGRGRARRWMTPPVAGFTTTLLLPAPLPID
jgi:hypothetical protein